MSRWKWLVVGGLAVAIVTLVLVRRALHPPTLPVASRQAVFLSRVTVINPGSDRRANQTVLIRDGRVAAISDSPPDTLPAFAYHQAGRYVLPGLIDMHVHLPVETVGLRGAFQTLFLSAGVTTVCQHGDAEGTITAAQQRVRDGEIAGPRILLCGRLMDGGARTDKYSRVVPDPAAAPRVVDDLAARGVDCLAVAAGLEGERLAAVRDAARRRGLAVFGQLPALPVGGGEDAESSRSEDVWRLWQAADAVGISAMVRAARQSELAYVPTLTAWERWANLDHPGRTEAWANHVMPPIFPALLWNPRARAAQPFGPWGIGDLFVNLGHGPGRDAMPPEIRNAALQTIMALVAMMRASGVPIHAGSDTPNPFLIPGISVLGEELPRLVAVGMTLEEAWAAATRDAGTALGVPLLGELRPGAPADLLVFREDPTKDWGALMTLEAVVADGRFYSARRLDNARTGFARFSRRWLSRILSRFLLRRLVEPTAADSSP